jgi:hypothetical protein
MLDKLLAKVVRALAAGLSSMRDKELMVIRDTIAARTDPALALEADVPNAAHFSLYIIILFSSF